MVISKEKTLTLALVSFLLVLGVLIFRSEGAGALPVCFNDATRRASAATVSGEYPRSNVSRNESGCGAVSNTNQWVLLSSYYEAGSGTYPDGPGSTLHTPNAEFRVFYSGSTPSSAVTITIERSATGRCDYTGGDDVVIHTIGPGGGFIGSLDSVASDTITAPAGEFSQNPKYGNNVWVWNKSIRVSANVATSIHCRIRASTATASTYLTLYEDVDPVSAHNETRQRYNQTNAGTGGGSKAILGPAANTSGSIALYSDLASSTLEYAIPIQLACDAPDGRYYLRYYDPDTPNAGNAGGTSQPAGTVGLAIYRESDGANILDTNINEGNDEYGEVLMPNMVQDERYTMVWYNVTARNGIQFWMPFSEATSIPGNDCETEEGEITCGDITRTSIEINWDTTDTTNARIRREDPTTATVGNNLAGTGTGTRDDTGLTPGTTYTYRLRNNSNSGTILDEITCDTTANAPPSVTVTVTCTPILGTATSTLRARYVATDPDGDSVDATASGGLTGTRNNDNDHTFSATVVRNGSSYSVTVLVDDGNGGTDSDSDSDTCDLPNGPSFTTDDLNCRRFSIELQDDEGFEYDIELQHFEGGSWVNTGYRRNNQALTGGPPSYSYSTDFTAVARWRDFDVHNFRVLATNQSFPSLTAHTDDPGDATDQRVGPCLETVCGGITTSPTSVSVNQFYTVSVQFSTRRVDGANELSNIGPEGNGGTAGSPFTYNIELSMSPAPPAGPNLANPMPISPAGSIHNGVPSPIAGVVAHDITSQFQAPSTPEDIDITFSLDSGDANFDRTCPGGTGSYTVEVAAQPYIQSFRGDVIAGYGILNNTGVCSTGSGNVVGSTVNHPLLATTPSLSNPVVGSGTQMSVLALGEVIGFRSGTTHTGYNDKPWSRIFANSTSTAPPNTSPPAREATSINDVLISQRMGGYYDSALCAENWSDDMPAGSTPASDVNWSDVNGIERYTSNGAPGDPVRLTADSTTDGTRKIFIDGNAIIGDPGLGANQEYEYTDSWTSVFDIPSVIIVASGNIYIDPNVTYLDGIFVAGGTIFTCTPTAGALPSDTDEISAAPSPSAYRTGGDCYDNSLTIQGALVSNNIRLWRTGGSVDKRWNSSTSSVVDSTGTQGYDKGLTQAETVRLTPELFISPRFGESPTNGDEGQKQLDSLISLPPIF